ncbi:unnamed protein product [Didymodactylos carnosus]|uniref:PPM-type phosphatase domain-containing protein n=1 Tax=Didymodactylos carnosus TaxID=1234261 RepID=A0A814WQY7_9BILA|nr:unnamed protein product [Didymodactylos carnosus]CAF1268111.1 unnamed protein product [Didymodactylos carnosus]CAF3968715.1 unnamed protein product [Didymodactylos carnosus]CAF4073886.1 unnamed protein product [Didymodactylos carnosus]
MADAKILTELDDDNRDGHCFGFFHRKSRNQSLLLERPMKDKELEHGKHENIEFAFGSMQGYRLSNEDMHKHLLEFDNQFWKLWSYFSIFDGHNGIDAAKHACDRLDKQLLTSLNHLLTKHDNSSYDSSESINFDIEEFKSAIKETYYKLDEELRSVIQDQSGSACITCLIGPEQIYLVNIGDSRALLVSKDGHILRTTKDHKPDDEEELKRIEDAGGKVQRNTGDVPRVENLLAITRVLGDFILSKEIVPPMADIIEYPRSSDEERVEFIVLACDGVFDVMTNEDVGQFIIKHLKQKSSNLKKLCVQLLDECLKRNSTDNMSVYIIRLNDNNEYEEAYSPLKHHHHLFHHHHHLKDQHHD